MKLAYVAGKYRGRTHNEIAQNIHAARSVATRLWELGYAVICPHTNSGFMSGVAAEEVFLEGGLEMLRRCDLLVLVDGWGGQHRKGLPSKSRKRKGLVCRFFPTSSLFHRQT